MTGFTWMWTRRELRSRWVALGLLALLVAVTTTTVFASLAGARRQASVIERLLSRTAPADVAILANTPGYAWRQVRALPEVARFTTFGLTLPVVGLPPTAEAEPILGRDMLRSIERPVVLSGRMFDPSRLDEGVVSPGFAAAYGRGVGSAVDVVLPTPAQLRSMLTGGFGGRFTGPRLHVRIVGVVITPWFSDSPGTPGELLLAPAVAKRYPASLHGDPARPQLQMPTNALARLRNGPADIPQLRADLAALPGVSGIDVWNLRQRFWEPAQHQATFTARWLAAFGLAALLASAVLVGSMLARYVAGRIGELRLLRPAGLTAASAATAAAAAPTLAGVLGVAAGIGGAVLVSDRLPLGSGRLAEPNPGYSADWVVFGPGLAAVVFLVAGGAAFTAWRSWRLDGSRAAGARRSALAAALLRSGAPVPAVLGARFALEPGLGVRRVPVRAAFVGVIAGVVGLVAALTFSHGVSDAATHPERFGQTYRASAFLGDNGHDFVPAGELGRALQSDSTVTGIDDVRVAVATGPQGVGSVTLLTYSWGRKPLPAVVTSGRLPTAPNEVFLAPSSLSDLHVAVGQPVELTGTSGARRFVVVGTGLLPVGAHNGYADGGWVTDAGFDAIFKTWRFHQVYVALRSAGGQTAPTATLNARLHRQPGLRGVSFAPPDPLQQVYELREVRQLPRALGLFLAVVALGAVGSAVVSAVRRRRSEVAVLRALGMTGRQSAAAVTVQATLLAGVGVVFGIPLGLALARTVWQGVADSFPFEYRPPWTAATWLVLPVALLATNLLAAGPALRAARLRIVDVLRAE